MEPAVNPHLYRRGGLHQEKWVSGSSLSQLVRAGRKGFYPGRMGGCADASTGEKESSFLLVLSLRNIQKGAIRPGGWVKIKRIRPQRALKSVKMSNDTTKDPPLPTELLQYCNEWG